MSARGGLSQSVHARLLAHARRADLDPNLTLTRFATERLLYRLSRSVHAERFVLKGGLMLLVWLGDSARSTRDADLLGFGDVSAASLLETFREVCGVEVEADGAAFLPESVRVTPIRAEDAYGGQRVKLEGRLGPARLYVQIDVGVGDAVTPDPEWLEYPALLDLPQPRLRAYRPETAIAEKLHAMVLLGSTNSRMRDFFDVYVLSRRLTFDGELVSAAVRDTFARRDTPIPSADPMALTLAFAELPDKQAQWTAFRRRQRVAGAPERLRDLLPEIAAFLAPVLTAARAERTLKARWSPGGPWAETP
jgi:hypothetical protein